MVGSREPQLGEEHRREVLVEMLTRVHQQLLVGSTQAGRHRRGLDELRSIADYREDLQKPSSDRIQALSAAIARPVTGATSSNVRSSIAATGWTSRAVEARKASSAF